MKSAHLALSALQSKFYVSREKLVSGNKLGVCYTN